MDWIQAVWWMISWLRYSLNHCCMSFSSPVVTWSSIRNSRGGGRNIEVKFLSVTPAACWCSGSPCPLSHTIMGSWSKTIRTQCQIKQCKHICCPGHNLSSTLKSVQQVGLCCCGVLLQNTGNKNKNKAHWSSQQPTNQPIRANTRQTMPLPTYVYFLKASSVLVASNWISVL